jgi:hypothetical protein
MDGIIMTDKLVKEKINLFKSLQLCNTIKLVLMMKAFQLTSY